MSKIIIVDDQYSHIDTIFAKCVDAYLEHLKQHEPWKLPKEFINDKK